MVKAGLRPAANYHTMSGTRRKAQSFTRTSPTRVAKSAGRRKVKGNMDIELAVDAMELAEHVDQMVLFSGDGDFRSLIEAVQRRGIRVTVVSTISSQPPMIADELRRQADVFIDLAELQVEDRSRSLRASAPARWDRASAARADSEIFI